MTTKFQIFLTKEDCDIKTGRINGIFSYPDPSCKTDRYRNGLQKYMGTEWAGAVDDKLVTACSAMTPAQRIMYYDDSDLKDHQWLVDNDWFQSFE